MEQAVGGAFRAWVEAHAGAIGVRMDELAWPGKVAALSDELINIYIPRVVGGIEVRGVSLSASVKFGNLVLVGTSSWADFDGVVVPEISMAEATDALRRHVGVDLFGRPIKSPYLQIVPMRVGPPGGESLTHRLVWALENDLREPGGRFEALVDAQTGELLALQDQIQWVAAPRRAQGGVFPVSNDGTPPDGTEQAGWPMPYATFSSGPFIFGTDVGGNAPVCIDGSASTRLSGPFVDMIDLCGVELLTGASNNLDWGTSAGTDCTTPGVGGAGNTHASRTGYHELNMIKAQARAQLPANGWLQDQLPAVMNITQTCNANWNGTSVNFFRSGGGCRNTGEIAGIFDHEWGHGMDDNDAVPDVSNPGEGIADIYANLRLNDSCIGRGFFLGGLCGGYGDPCTVASGCSGVRDTDYANRTSGAPHGIVWINNNCGGGPAPCGGGVHCEGAVYAESVWDLWNRELTSAPFNYDLDRAREIATHATYTGATAVGPNWYSCADLAGPDFENGCAAANGYMKYLVANDDNGNLNDGTPHMTAINDAFASHGIDCSVPTVQNGGCAGAPTLAPVLGSVARDKGVDLGWAAVPNTTEYEIYRTDGVFGCNFGKIKIGTTASTSFQDRGLQNGRTYSYQVFAKGAADSCYGPASNCSQIAPSAAGGDTLLSILPDSVLTSSMGGDSDYFIDNCEVAKLSIPLGNNSTTTLTNVVITAAASTSHPTSVLLTSLPKPVAASLPSCANTAAVVEFQARALAAGQTFEADITIDADQIAPTVVHVVSERPTEGNFQTEATFTWNFLADEQGWVEEQGTFVRVIAGIGSPPPDAGWFQSSSTLPDQCDVVRSPLVRLSATSTLSMQNHFEIEPFFAGGGVWYDRANLVFRNYESEETTLVSPSSGRAYNASGPNGSCGTFLQAGWAGNFQTWAASNWSAAALQAPTLAGKPGNLVVRYGTDPADERNGFRFDLVTLTNFDREIADAQGNSCVASSFIFGDDFNSGNTSQWSLTAP
jgi:hypothetical protein